jgi:hypothetical protein
MDKLFIPIHTQTLKVGWGKNLFQKLIPSNERWGTDWTCQDTFAQRALSDFSNRGMQEVMGRTFKYELLQVQRVMHAHEVCHRLEKRSHEGLPYPMEMVELVEALPKHLSGKFISMPWTSYQTWVSGIRIGRKKHTFIMHYQMALYKAGSVFMTRTPVD